MSFQQGAGFRVCGAVVRRWTNPAGTFATCTLDVFVDGKGKKLDFRGFKEVVTEIACLTPGQIVEFTGTPDVEKLTAKDKSEVKVDGYNVWVTKLTVRAVKVESSGRSPTGETSSSARSRELQKGTPPADRVDDNDPSTW
jgi:hypothetical protein